MLKHDDVSYNAYFFFFRKLFGDRCIRNPGILSIIVSALPIQHPQGLFQERFSVSKNDATFSNISVALVVVSRKEQKIPCKYQ